MSEKTLGVIAFEEFDKALRIKMFGRNFDAEAIPIQGDHEAWESAAQAVIEAHEARKWQPIETMPSDVYFLAENEQGDWIKSQRYENTANLNGFYVVDKREGKWFYTIVNGSICRNHQRSCNE